MQILKYKYCLLTWTILLLRQLIGVISLVLKTGPPLLLLKSKG